jgi:LacI family transcriptional regulator
MPEQIAIGLVLPLHHEVGQHSLRGILRYAAEHPEIRLLDFCFFRDEDDLEAPRRPPSWIGRVDGVVLQLSKSPGVVEYIQSGGVPAVNAFADLSTTPIVSVYTDGRSLAHVAIEHLCAVGFRSIACVAHHKLCHRRKAYREDLKKRGRKLLAAVDDIQLFHHWSDESFDINAVRPSLAKLIESAKKPLGIVAINDFIAIVVCRVVKSLGLRIPDDVGVLGVGDMSIAEINSPPLSTMRVPSDSIGYEAVRRVHQMIEGRTLPEKNFTVSGVKLVARSSTVGEQRTTSADIKTALEVIRHRACDGATVASIAAELHMSVRKLEIDFVAAVGHTVGEELRRARLARAEELLANTNLSLTRVANLVGCNDSSYLANMFRRSFNLTPTEFRKQRNARR